MAGALPASAPLAPSRVCPPPPPPPAVLCVSKGLPVTFEMAVPNRVPRNTDELRQLESAHQVAMLWLWLSYRFDEEAFPGREQVGTAGPRRRLPAGGAAPIKWQFIGVMLLVQDRNQTGAPQGSRGAVLQKRSRTDSPCRRFRRAVRARPDRAASQLPPPPAGARAGDADLPHAGQGAAPPHAPQQERSGHCRHSEGWEVARARARLAGRQAGRLAGSWPHGAVA